MFIVLRGLQKCNANRSVVVIVVLLFGTRTIGSI